MRKSGYVFLKQKLSNCLQEAEFTWEFTIYNGPTNALFCNKGLIQMSHTKTFKNHSNMFGSSDDHHQGGF
jgi:hypothetical protein